VDYNLESTIPGLFVAGEAKSSEQDVINAIRSVPCHY